jgi:hypothetical protein
MTGVELGSMSHHVEKIHRCGTAGGWCHRKPERGKGMLREEKNTSPLTMKLHSLCFP